MSTNPTTVLVLCTGNSCRSILAEALINHLGQGRSKPGVRAVILPGTCIPAPSPPYNGMGVDPGKPRSKSWDEMTTHSFDLVITVCDQAAAETCPIFSGQPRKLHWSIPDPGRVAGTEEEINAAFDQAFFLLKTRIEDLLS